MNARFRTPHSAILVTGGFVAVALFLKLDILVEAASLVLLVGYILSCLCVIVLRESRLQNYQPLFRSPLYPWTQVIGIIGFALLIFEMGMEAFLITSLLIVMAFLMYWFYGRRRMTREFALLHLVQRITSKELVTGTLESELKEIIRERDDIVIDRFDRTVAACPVLDIEETTTADNVFQKVAETMSDRLGIEPAALHDLLTEREKESSTVLRPGFAVPHIVIEGEGRFDILLVRCQEGIQFSGEPDPVHAVFVLMGTIDERNFHLRSLAGIAQIVQHTDFEKKWMTAHGEQALRDIVLLGQRRRD